MENSIFHGVENIIGQGCISVRVLPDGEDHLVISVSDNGAGIQEEYLRQLQDQIMSDELINHSTNVGIMNVAQRIKLFYGEQYHLEIKSQVGKGTVVRMRLPVKIPESEVIRTSPYREVKKDEKI